MYQRSRCRNRIPARSASVNRNNRPMTTRRALGGTRRRMAAAVAALRGRQVGTATEEAHAGVAASSRSAVMVEPAETLDPAAEDTSSLAIAIARDGADAANMRRLLAFTLAPS